MKKQTQLHTANFPELKAVQAIDQISKWIDERYPRLTPGTKSKIITECLLEIREERIKLLHLN